MIAAGWYVVVKNELSLIVGQPSHLPHVAPPKKPGLYDQHVAGTHSVIAAAFEITFYYCSHRACSGADGIA
jgi:hypothetical protein